jgi:hypothetical protein
MQHPAKVLQEQEGLCKRNGENLSTSETREEEDLMPFGHLIVPRIVAYLRHANYSINNSLQRFHPYRGSITPCPAAHSTPSALTKIHLCPAGFHIEAPPDFFNLLTVFGVFQKMKKKLSKWQKMLFTPNDFALSVFRGS